MVLDPEQIPNPARFPFQENRSFVVEKWILDQKAIPLDRSISFISTYFGKKKKKKKLLLGLIKLVISTFIDGL
jgi:hypothetical protein